MSTFDAVLSGLGAKSVDALKMTLAESWDSLSYDEKQAATKLMLTLAEVHLLSLAGVEVSSELKTLDAAFKQWQVVGKQVVVDGAKKVATEVFGYGGSFLGGAVAAFIKGIK